MTVEKKESGPCVVSLTARLDAEEIKAECGKVFNMFMRECAVPGFRKGKVPADVIRRKFRQEIDQECSQRCFREFYPKAVEEAKLEVVKLQGVSEVDFTDGKGFSFTALVEVRPVFDLPKYKKLSIKAPDATVSDEQVTESMEQYRVAFAKYEDAKPEDVAAAGDFLQIDYSGTLDDKEKTPLSQVVPDQKVVCEGTGFWTQMEDGRFVPEILDALKGMKVGDSKEGVKVKFPAEAAPESLKGKKCLYKVTLKALRRRILPDDAAFAEAAKVANLDELRAQTRERLERQAADAALANRKDQAIELLLKKCDFDVPPSLVRRQTQAALEDMAQRAQYSGISTDYLEKNRDNIVAEAENSAIRQVRLSYVLLGIADAEKIEVSDDDVTAALEKMAASGGTSVEALRKQLDESNRMDLYKEQLRAERALDLVLAEAK